MQDIKIIAAEKDTPVALNDIHRLLKQLSSSPITFDDETYRTMVASENSKLFLMYDNDLLIGMLTVASYLCPTGKKYWIEDVVIDESYRGQGLGRRLLDSAIAYVSTQGKASLMLTSRPSRVAANALYQSVGFEKRTTNVYRIKF